MMETGIRKAKEMASGFTEGKKVADMSRDTTDVHAPNPFTTDHGTKVENTDNWARVVDDKHTGPSLLEDQIAREKVPTLEDDPRGAIPERWLTK